MKRRILSDQKRKALRRVLIAAAALVLINHFLRAYQCSLQGAGEGDRLELLDLPDRK